MFRGIAQLAGLVEHRLHAPVHHVIVEHRSAVSAANSAVEDRMFAVLRTDVDAGRPSIVFLVTGANL